jgi:hypothetical protein
MYLVRNPAPFLILLPSFNPPTPTPQTNQPPPKSCSARAALQGGRVRVIKDGRELVLFDPNDETKKGGYDFRKLPFPVQYVQGIAQLKENKAAAAAAAAAAAQVGVHME